MTTNTLYIIVTVNYTNIFLRILLYVSYIREKRLFDFQIIYQ